MANRTRPIVASVLAVLAFAGLVGAAILLISPINSGDGHCGRVIRVISEADLAPTGGEQPEGYFDPGGTYDSTNAVCRERGFEQLTIALVVGGGALALGIAAVVVARRGQAASILARR